MKQVNIYVEGKGDMLFLAHFITNHFGVEFEIDAAAITARSSSQSLQIIITAFDGDSKEGGIDQKKISGLIEEILNVNAPLGIQSVIFIDADTPAHKHPQGGFTDRNAYLEKFQATVDFSFFIIPNHSDNGNLEDLLDTIIATNGKPFYECLSRYVTCLENISGPFIPKYVEESKCMKKEKILWYTYMMLGKKTSKSEQQNYLQADLWDLTSVSLNPLKLFLAKIVE